MISSSETRFFGARTASSAALHTWLPAELELMPTAPLNGARNGTVPVDEATQRAALEEAYRQGFEDGVRRGVEDGRRQESGRLTDAHTLLEEVASELRNGERRWVSAARENLIALATAIAAHIIGREMKGDAQAVTDLVRRALSEFPLDEPVRIRLHPEDLSTIAVITAPGAAPVAPGRELRWVADPAIRPGGCLVEGRERIVDARVDRALERIYRQLSDG